MSRSIEQNLLSLMPTHGSQLPPRLVDTARTLLTHLRKVEDYAGSTTYRAKAAYPPRVYKRLYTHLDNILPGKQPGFVKSIQPDIGLHPWVRGVLAVLVAEFRKEEYGKFVLAGIEYVIAPGSRRTRDKWILSHLPATVAGIFVVSMNRLETILGSEESEVDSLFVLLEKTLDIMDHARENLDVKGLGSNEFWAGWTTPTVGDVEAAIKRATSGWVDADWYAALEDTSLLEDFVDSDLGVAAAFRIIGYKYHGYGV
ncbi:unnamed protein product [Parascedosporium putredinis]|uniref:Uncharacterized protein n=1 Tax=Parascedosporium putredinis TaxID=1442378 RepID=A0A9P1GVN8_9PEZI|nr:unnamed protein product [Parascedosporium putredinis]CAI7987916.1 unnamed protein product [Parascedosporium putredinis]